jgi:ketosteroid isomerase-like protein
MSEQDNIKHARQIFDAWNSHDVERYVKLLDEKIVIESDTLPQTVKGRDAARQFLRVYVRHFQTCTSK